MDGPTARPTVDEALAQSLAAGLDVAIAAAFAGAGVLVVRRRYVEGAKRASRMFALWWFGVAATGAGASLVRWLWDAGADPRLLDAADHLTLLTHSAALVGFTSYVSYIYLGHHKADAIIVSCYVVLASWSIASVLAAPATGYHLASGRRVMERPPSFGPPAELTAILLVVPLLVAMVAYASLFWRSDDRRARFRIALVSAALFGWLAGVTLISLPGLVGAGEVAIGARVLILACAGILLVAYRPPGLLRRWLGDAGALAEALRRRAGLEERVRDLV